MNTPLILVTNDDGILSPGLLAAIEAVADFGELVIAAPTTQQTARGRAIMGDPNDHFHPTELAFSGGKIRAYHIDGSPALVVRHALFVLLGGRKPDLVVSGINYGENLGTNITISGTIGAALQAASHGIMALAVSRQTDIEHHFTYSELDWTDATRVTRTYARRLLAIESRAAAPFDLLKLDIPDPCPPGTVERITRLSRSAYFRSVLPGAHPDSRIGEARTTVGTDPRLTQPDDDIYAIEVDRVVSVTPLTLDCTAPLTTSAALLGMR